MSKKRKKSSSNSWDPVADWYIGWVGAKGSEYHRKVAIPTVMDMLSPSNGEAVLDVGCGTAALAPHVVRAGATYTGVDASHRLVAFARRHHGADARLVRGDATRLREVPGITGGAFDAVTFLLSIQDIDPLELALHGAAWALGPGGRIVILMTHPCFRIPRQSGWGWDEGRRLEYRRVDRYMTPLAVPMKSYGRDRQGATRSHHRPIEEYVRVLADDGLLIEAMREIPVPDGSYRGKRAKAKRRASEEIPLFMAIRAVKR